MARFRSLDGLAGSPEVVDAVRAMAERGEGRAAHSGPTLTVWLTGPLSVLVASIQVLRNLGVTEAIETEGLPPAAPGLPLGTR